jgi:hypothetical protein
MATVADIHHRLSVLAEERELAHQCGLDRDVAYMADLESEIAATHAAFVGGAVVEIACLRARLSGTLEG